MSSINSLRSFLIEWNNTFPLDRFYRKKNNIVFNSDKHREVCQIDIYLDWLENQMFDEHEENLEKIKQRNELYQKGQWLSKPELSDEDQSKLFDSIDIDKL